MTVTVVVSAAAADAVNLPVERGILVLHPFERFNGGVAARFRRLSFRGEFGFLPLIASFALRLGRNEAALFHRASL